VACHAGMGGASAASLAEPFDLEGGDFDKARHNGLRTRTGCITIPYFSGEFGQDKFFKRCPVICNGGFAFGKALDNLGEAL